MIVEKGLTSPNRYSKYLFRQGMGLCPITPPKGFPVALWKPSGAYPLIILKYKLKGLSVPKLQYAYFAVRSNHVLALMTPQLCQLSQPSILSVRYGKKPVCHAKVSANISSSARC